MYIIPTDLLPLCALIYMILHSFTAYIEAISCQHKCTCIFNACADLQKQAVRKDPKGHSASASTSASLHYRSLPHFLFIFNMADVGNKLKFL